MLLILLAIVHLVATPDIAKLIRHSTSVKGAEWLTPPMLLNHIVVGALLFPLGYLTMYAAPGAGANFAWAQVVVRTSALTVATLPVILVILMGRSYLGALFLLGIALVVAAAAILLIAAFSKSRQ